MESRKYVDRLGIGLHPFDPKSDTPQDVGLGGPSTEYLATMIDWLGYPVNVPQIWWDKSGSPHIVSEQNALALASEFESATSTYFPRYNSLGQAEEFARNRSAQGGATNNSLAQSMTANPSNDFRQIVAALIRGNRR